MFVTMVRLVLGIDAGGTSTRAVLVNARGEVLGYGAGGRGNPVSLGYEQAAMQVIAAIRSALHGHELAEVGVIVAAMAGVSASGEGNWLKKHLVGQGFTGRLVFESDPLAIYFSGSASLFGYTLLSGTGASAIRVVNGVIDATSDGLGWLVGDQGSGFWIGRRVAQAVVQDLDGTGLSTELTPKILNHYEVNASGGAREGRPDALDLLLRKIYTQSPLSLAALAPYAFMVEDQLCSAILCEAGEALAHTLASVLTKPGPVVLGGSVLTKHSQVFDTLRFSLGTQAERLDFFSVPDGVAGVAFLALREAKLHPNENTRKILTDTLEGLR